MMHIIAHLVTMDVVTQGLISAHDDNGGKKGGEVCAKILFKSVAFCRTKQKINSCTRQLLFVLLGVEVFVC